MTGYGLTVSLTEFLIPDSSYQHNCRKAFGAHSLASVDCRTPGSETGRPLHVKYAKSSNSMPSIRLDCFVLGQKRNLVCTTKPKYNFVSKTLVAASYHWQGDGHCSSLETAGSSGAGVSLRGPQSSLSDPLRMCSYSLFVYLTTLLMVHCRIICMHIGLCIYVCMHVFSGLRGLSRRSVTVSPHIGGLYLQKLIL
jgi:hypothetical protein